MEVTWNLLLDGLARGAIFGIIALGYTMVYGVIKLINFAHGEFFMVGAFAAYFFIHALPLEAVPLAYPYDMIVVYLAAAVVASAAAILVAMLAEFFAYRPLRNASRISLLLTTLGVSLLLQNGTLKLFSSETKAFPDPRRYVTLHSLNDGTERQNAYYTDIPGQGARVVLMHGEIYDPKTVTERTGGVLPGRVYQRVILSKNFKRWFAYGVLAVLTAALAWLVHSSKLGIAMRAVAQNRTAAKLMGISINRIVILTFVIGSALAGIGGVMHGLYYTTVHPLMGFMPGIKAFVASVVGGIGSIPGAVLGSLLIGILEVGAEGAGLAAYRDVIAFLLLILFLVFRPQGIFATERGDKL